MGKTLWLLVVGVYSFSAFGSELTLKDVQKALKSRGASWVAGETSVSHLSPEEKSKRFGYNLPAGFSEMFKSRMPANRALPSSFDWRNVDGVSYASPILNQGNCGSCVAFSAIGTLETQMNVTRKTPSSPWAYSPQYLFACGGGGCETGWQPDSAAEFLKNTGVPDESCFPYMSGATGKDLACSDSCSNASQRMEKILGYSQPTFFLLDVDAVKAALQNGPLMTTMMVYEDFLFYKSGVYKHVTGGLAGGHGVSIVGYNDAEQAFIVRNSWGDTFGENGFFKIDYNDVSQVGGQTWAFEVPQMPNGYVTLGNLRDNAVLTGSTDVAVESTVAGTQSVDITLTKGRSPVWFGMASAMGRAALDTAGYADGAYTVTATAHTPSGDVSSQPRHVFILNHPFSGSVKITNLTNGQTLSAQTTLNLDVQASPIPFTKLTIHKKNVATGEDTVSSTGITVPQMTLLWRAQLATNGQYDITIEGTAGPTVHVVSTPIRVTVQH